MKGLKADRIAGDSEAYRALIEQRGGTVIREKRNFSKSEVALLFQTSYRFSREDLEGAFEEQVPEPLRGVVDWEVN